METSGRPVPDVTTRPGPAQYRLAIATPLTSRAHMKLLFQSLTAHAESTPEKTAVVFRQQRMTYGEWERDSNRAAHVLRANGVVAGDRVCLAIPKSPLALIWSLGILKAG